MWLVYIFVPKIGNQSKKNKYHKNHLLIFNVTYILLALLNEVSSILEVFTINISASASLFSLRGRCGCAASPLQWFSAPQFSKIAAFPVTLSDKHIKNQWAPS